MCVPPAAHALSTPARRSLVDGLIRGPGEGPRESPLTRRDQHLYSLNPAFPEHSPAPRTPRFG